MAKIAVLTFPGNNCEVETLRAVKNAGLDAEIFLWNQDATQLETFDGVVIPGGFSFEDRGRSGIVSAQEPVIQAVKKMAQAGKPVIGICNGAQIVVESGLILESKEGIPMVSLSRNKRKNEAGEVLGTGFYHSWRTLKNTNDKTPFSRLCNDMHIPLAHGEGRFVFPENLEKEVIEKNLVVYQYVDTEGEADEHYPTNPNGSFHNAAAVCNPAGNVMAIMPHPERTQEGSIIFDSLKLFLENGAELNAQDDVDFSFGERTEISEKDADVEFLVQLKITDKTEKTFESVLQKKGFENAKVTRRVKWKMNFDETLSDTEKQDRVKQIVQSNELLNANKESVIVKISGNFWKFAGGEFSAFSPEFSGKNSFEVRENEDFVGESKKDHLSHIFPQWNFSEISHGIFWTVEGVEKSEILQTPLFASFVGETIFSA